MQPAERYMKEAQGAEAVLAGSALPWMRELRRRATARFAELGFPTTKREDFRYTNVEPLLAIPFARVTSASRAAVPVALGDAAAPRLVFVDGRFAPEHSTLSSLPAGVVITSLAGALERHGSLVQPHLATLAGPDRHGFLALNAALADDGAFVFVPRGARMPAPIELTFVASERVTPSSWHVRNLVVADENAEVHVVERYAGGANATYFTNAVTEVVLGANASVRHLKLQQEGASAYHVSTIQARQGRDSRFASWSLALGGALARTEVHTELAGSGADARLYGLYSAGGRQLVDHHTFIDHAAPRCTSNELYKGVLDGMARGVFNGTILVRRDAQKTAAFQSNKNLVLSQGAVVDTRPQLEIYADDVKCSHGATIGRLEEDALFYLRTRGVGLEEARHLLTLAFVTEIVQSIENPELQRAAHAAVLAVLPHAVASEIA